MGWLSFAEVMSETASQLSDSDCPMVLVFNGKEIRFDDIRVELVGTEIKCRDKVYPSYEYHITLLNNTDQNPQQQ